MKKGFFKAAIMMLFMLAVVKIDAKAANVIETKNENGDGYNITWTMYDDGTLDITGTGELTALGFDKYDSGIKKVGIGNGITSIGSYAFSGCSSLTSVTIPNSVTSIESYAFSGCSSLTSVTIPNSVTSIEIEAFSSCYSLTSVTIPNSVTSIGDCAFSGCSSLTSVTIPNSVTSIGSGAFSGCDSLISVTIPNSVTSIGDYAFSGCKNLINVEISDQLLSRINVDIMFEDTPWLLKWKGSISGAAKDIFYTLDSDGNLTLSGSGEFYLDSAYNHLVKTIYISASTTSINNIEHWGYWADTFPNIEKIVNYSTATVKLEKTDEYAWCDINDQTEPIFSISKGTAVLVHRNLVKHYTIKFDGNGATSGSMDDLKADSNTDQKLPPNGFLKKGYSFEKWDFIIEGKTYSLFDNGSIYISESSIVDNEIETIALTAQWKKDPNYGVKKAGTTITDKKSNAKYIVLSSKNKTVKYSKPTNKSATTITIPATITYEGVTYKVTEVNSKAIKGYKKVTTIKIGKNVTKIGDEAFSGCTKLTSLTIGANVTTIGNKAFYNTAIKNLTLPAKTVKLGKQFAGKNSKMKTLTIKSSKMTKKTLTDGACAGIGSKVTVKVPKSKVSAYTKLFQSKGLNKKVKVKAWR